MYIVSFEPFITTYAPVFLKHLVSELVPSLSANGWLHDYSFERFMFGQKTLFYAFW